MTDRPIESPEAADISRSIERACKTRDPSALIRLMTKDAVWRDNDAVHVGRDEIWTALSKKWANAIHCALQQDIESHDADAIVIRFESEWQHSLRGRWYRSSGVTRISQDDEGHIATVESTVSDTQIAVSERRLSISPATPAKSAC